MLRRDDAPDPAAPSLDAGSLPDAAGLARPVGASAAPDVESHNRVGSARYIRTSLALFLAGFATFSLLYCPQPLLPTLSRAFGIDAAAASLSISVSTAALALSIVAAATLSDLKGRKAVMMLSLLLASALNALAAFAPNWALFLLCRGLEGVALGGVPAVAMTYLAEETEARGLGLAMGIYVGATAVGGMGGRVITGLVAASYDWRTAVGAIGLLGLANAVGFLLLLPASRHFRTRAVDVRSQARAFGAAVADLRLLLVYAFAFLAMGGFVAIYNYAGFRLEASPYGLDQAQEGLIFTLYLLGTVSSTLAGTLADRLGRAPVMALALAVALCGVVATLFAPLSAIVLGIALVTLGFFAGHGVASGTVGGFAGSNKAQAASLYLLSYYAGSSILGTVGGIFWTAGRWTGVAGLRGGAVRRGDPALRRAGGRGPATCVAAGSLSWSISHPENVLVTIRSVRLAHDGWLKLRVATLSGDDGVEFNREIDDHGPAVAVLPYDAQRRVALLVKLPRAPVLFKGATSTFLEAPAGIREADEDPAACARREAMEEVGVELDHLDEAGHTWSMCGVSTERMHLFLAPYTEARRTAKGGGLAEEHENIVVVEVPLADLRDMADRNVLDDMKTLCLVQTLRLRRPELFA